MFQTWRTPNAVLFTAIMLIASTACAENPRFTPLVKAVEKCRDFVVNIHTVKSARSDGDSRFFGQKSQQVSGMGTGIVVDERGYIVTNYHVIHEVDQITVTLDGGETVEARPVSFDRKHDMAIIHINASTPLKVMPIGTSKDVRLAEQVFAVGNAFGYEYTVTAGIVSALGRDVEVDETQAYENLIQTDASINPGNSGGPLLNVMGEVIGINVAIRAGAQRIGFAIPIDDARVTIARLLSTRRLNGMQHGLTGDDVKTASNHSLVVRGISPGTPAHTSGIKKGDVIKSVRGVSIHDGADWERCLLDMPTGRQLTVNVDRNGQPLNLKLTIGQTTSGQQTAATRQTPASPPVRAVSSSKSKPEDDVRQKLQRLLGVQVVELTSREQAVLRPTKFNGGMKIVGVSNTVAQRTGVRRGDILLGLNGYETLSDHNLKYILQDKLLKNQTQMKTQFFRMTQNGPRAWIRFVELDK